ncbi:helix-turn-helix transcriptional regulator [Streptomyces sp. WAC 04229]|uniref:helix-turn-helix transcriptional regulator n=1 Tax=Streptomyces sp. WAC 04229 TaxID=2203206 RepID=UPI003D70EABC
MSDVVRRHSETPVLVGRTGELHALLDALAHPPAVVLVEGEAGIGKTRLIREVLGHSSVRGRTVLAGGCHPLREPFPYGPVFELLRRLEGRLPDGLNPVCGALRPYLPELGDRLPPAPEPLTEHGAVRHRLFRAVRALLEGGGVGVVVVEDLHWADDGTRDLVRFLVDDPPAGLAVVLSYRREELPGAGLPLGRAYRQPPGTTAVLVPLGPLDVSAVRSMTAALTGNARVPAALAEALHERTAGIPFVLEEVVRALPDGWDGADPLDAVGVPTRLHEAMADRMSLLSPEAVACVRACAVLRVPTGEELIAAVAGVGAVRTGTALREALRASVLHELGPDRYGFRHTLAQQAVYRGMTGPARRALHRDAVRALDGTDPPPLVQLTYHARESGDTTRWHHYGKAAARAALRTGDLALAVELLESLLSDARLGPLERARLAIRLSRAAVHSVSYRQAAELLRRTVQDDRLPDGLRGEIRLNLGLLLHNHAGDYEQARADTEIAVEELHTRPALAARGMAALALPGWGDHPYRVYERWIERAEALVGRGVGVTGGGMREAGPWDAGLRDEGPRGGGLREADPSDAEPTDRGLRDAGPLDPEVGIAGRRDPGLRDAGPWGAGLPAAEPRDPGLRDAGPTGGGLRDTEPRDPGPRSAGMRGPAPQGAVRRDSGLRDLGPQDAHPRAPEPQGTALHDPGRQDPALHDPGPQDTALHDPGPQDTGLQDAGLRMAVLGNHFALRACRGERGVWEEAEVALRGGGRAGAEVGVQAARTWGNLADYAAWLGQDVRARRYCREAERLAGEHGATFVAGIAAGTELRLDWHGGRWEGLAERARRTWEGHLGVAPVMADAQLVLGQLALARGEWEEAEARLSGAGLGDPDNCPAPVLAAASAAMVRLLLARGGTHAACALADRATARVRRKDIWGWGAELSPMVVAAYVRAERRAEAEAVTEQLAAGLAGLDVPLGRPAVDACRGILAAAGGRHDDAVTAFRAARAGYAALPRPYAAARAGEAAAREALATGAADAARRMGDVAEEFTALGATRDAARCRRVLRGTGVATPSHRGRRGYGDTLSPREREVARLVALGHTNREIADVLFLSPRTIEQHVAKVLRKLGVASRAEVQAEGA